MSSAQSTTSVSQPSVPAQPDTTSQPAAPAQPAPAAPTQPANGTQPAAPAPELSTSGGQSSTRLQAKEITVSLADMRQITLEDGQIIDIPIAVLQNPALKPTQFVNLQHHFAAHRGEPVDLSQCETADEAIDILADEVEAVRLVLYGYIVNFQRYVERFEAAHEELRAEILSMAESYKGLVKMSTHAEQIARQIGHNFVALSERIEALPSGSAVRPPKIPKIPSGRGLANPEMSAEDSATMSARKHGDSKERDAAAAVVRSGWQLKDAAVLKEAISPAPSSSKRAARRVARKPRGRGTKVMLKIDKVVEGVEAAREQLHVVDMMTKRKIVVIRRMEYDEKVDINELWGEHQRLDHHVGLMRKLSKENEVQLKKWGEWTEVSKKTAAAPETSVAATATPDAVSSTPPEAADAQEDTSSADVQDSPLPLSTPAPADPAAPAPADPAITAPAPASIAPATVDAVSSTPPEAADPPSQEDSSSADAQDSPLPLSTPAPATAAPAPTATATAQPHVHISAPPVEGDIYAVSLDLLYNKDLNELTRDEAIQLLTMLPLRVQFVPYGAPLETDTQEEDENEVIVIDDDDDDDDDEAKSVESVEGLSCPSSAEKAAAAAAVPESPTPRSETHPRSRKRTRNEHDEDEDENCAVEAIVDPRLRSGGSPVKRKRAGNA